ncbi:MAG TPA: efflux RND transporter periplasmic adaptor subunit [Tepidisphaeraceae bacterium]|jgi:RND family efflux transporter MFP subunit|nr:efflux RND transporter periplasmic adaptor subunit [Tepidisphaeraceae bacterium]
MLKRAGILVAVVLILLGYLVYTQHRHVPLKVSGFIEADEIRVGSRVGGRVSKVSAIEGAPIKTGELLVELEPYDLLSRQAQAEAQLISATAATELAKLTAERMKITFESHATSASEVDRTQSELKSAIAQQNLRKAELDQAAEQIKELKIFAPVDGVVEAVDLRPGDLISPNAPVLSVLDTSHLWVRAYLPENHLNVQIGQKIPITVDSFQNRKFTGHISFIARQAEFTPDNIQTPEERSKQVFRIKVELDEGLDVLRPGMTADVWLDDAGR